MRRAPLACLILACSFSGSCSRPPAFEPVQLSEARSLDAEVLREIQTRIAAVRAAPSDARAHALLGVVYEANGVWDAAEQSYAHALAIQPGEALWQFHRALALREGGRSAEALAALRESAARLEREPGVQQRLGQWLLEGGELEGARQAFERALSARPDRSECLTGLAGVELARERWDAALALAQRAQRVDPGYRPAYYAAGQALLGLKRDAEAKTCLATGLNARVRWIEDPLSAELARARLASSALLDDAVAAESSGNRARAAELYELLSRRKPDDADLANNLGANLLELGRLERAAEVLNQALALAPGSFPVHLNLSDLHVRRQELAQARQEADKAVELGGTVGRTHYQRALVLALQKDIEGSYREMRTAIDLDARNPDAFVALSELCMRLQRYEEARGWVRRAVELNPALVPARFNQGLLAVRAGDAVEARLALAALEKLAPGHERTSKLRDALAQLGQ